MLERGGAAAGHEIGPVLHDVPPVRHVADRGEEVFPEPDEVPRPEQRHGADGEGEHRGEGGEQPSSPPPVEAGQGDAPRALQFCDQQRRDEESGDDEEQVDAQEAPGHPADSCVVEQHPDHGERAQSVEPWPVDLLGWPAVHVAGARVGCRPRRARVPASGHDHGCRARVLSVTEIARSP